MKIKFTAPLYNGMKQVPWEDFCLKQNREANEVWIPWPRLMRSVIVLILHFISLKIIFQMTIFNSLEQILVISYYCHVCNIFEHNRIKEYLCVFFPKQYTNAFHYE